MEVLTVLVCFQNLLKSFSGFSVSTRVLLLSDLISIQLQSAVNDPVVEAPAVLIFLTLSFWCDSHRAVPVCNYLSLLSDFLKSDFPVGHLCFCLSCSVNLLALFFFFQFPAAGRMSAKRNSCRLRARNLILKSGFSKITNVFEEFFFFGRDDLKSQFTILQTKRLILSP